MINLYTAMPVHRSTCAELFYLNQDLSLELVTLLNKYLKEKFYFL